MKKDILSSKIKLSNSKNAYDGKKLNNYRQDEYVQMPRSEGKVVKIRRAFYLYYEKGFFWFRFFDGYGVLGRSQKWKSFELFSERYGYTKYLNIFGWELKWLTSAKV